VTAFWRGIAKEFVLLALAKGAQFESIVHMFFPVGLDDVAFKE
jgi:hypothetical protein